MTPQRLGTFIAGVLTALAIVAGLWLAQRIGSRLEQATAPTPAPTPPPLPSVSPTAVVAVASGYRLAGVAVNANQLYAVIESPDGSHGLFRQNDEVPGLGRLQKVEAERAIIATTSGNLTLRVMPAASPSPTNTRPPVTPTVKRGERRTLPRQPRDTPDESER